MKKTSIYKIVFISFIILIIVGFSVSEIYSTKKINDKVLINELKEDLNKHILYFHSEIQSVVNIIQIIQGSEFFRKYLTVSTQISKKRLNRQFVNICKNNSSISQLRYLNNEGLEIIRINQSREGVCTIVPEKNLQSKKHRNYFSQSNKLKKREIYFSELDLNVENNRIEKPWIPTIRIAVLALDENENKQGIIVVNFVASKILDVFNDFPEAFQNNRGHLFLNYKGEYLKGFTKDQDFSFLLSENKSRSFRNEFEKLWEEISSKTDGIVNNEKYNFVFQNEYLNRMDEKTRFTFVVYFEKENLWDVVLINKPILLVDIFLILITILFAIFLSEEENKKIEYEQKQAEADRELKSLIDNALVGIFIIKNNKIEYGNSKFASMLGYNQVENIIGKDFNKILFGLKWGLLKKNFENLENFEERSSVYIIWKENEKGEKTYLEIFEKVINEREESAKVIVVNDITEKHKSEMEIREFNQKINAVSNLSNTGYFEYDIKNRTFSFSKELAELLNLNEKEEYHFSEIEKYFVSDFNKTLNLFEGVLKNKASEKNEINIILPNKERKDVLVSIAPDGNFFKDRKKIIGSILDISESKKQININKARFHLMQFSVNHNLDEFIEEALNEAERLTDSKIGFYHFVDDNQNSLTLQGWSTQTQAKFCKVAGKGMHYPIEQAGVWVECIEKKKAVIHNDYENLPNKKGMPEGHAQVIRELTFPVLRGDKILAIMGVGNKESLYNNFDIETISIIANLTWEIAERKITENKLKKYHANLEYIVEERTEQLKISENELKKALEKEKELVKLKTQLIATISHEFKTPLTSIFSSVELLEMFSQKFTPKKKAQLYGQVKNSVDRLTTMVNEVLELSRIERGVIKIQKEIVNLKDFIKKITTDVELTFDKKHELFIELKLSKEEYSLDKNSIQTIIYNLISNAIKYSPKGGKVYLNIYEADGNLEIKIKDEGIGIKESEQKRIFKEFYRMENTLHIEGTGLGLTIVKTIVEKLNGQINVHSIVEEGSEFTVTFPIS